MPRMIVDGVLVPRTLQIVDATVVVVNGQVTAVVVDGREIPPEPGDVHVSGGGRVLLPAMIDSYARPRTPLDLRRALRHGVATVVDPGRCPPADVPALRAAACGDDAADLRSAGSLALGGGAPDEVVAGRRAAGADLLSVDLDALDPDAAAPLIAAADRQGLRTVGLVTTRAAFRAALRLNIEIVLGVPRDVALSDDDVAAVRASGVATVPALAATGGSTAAATSTAALIAAEARVLAGSGAVEPSDHGIALHRELELLVQAGLTPWAALETATTVPSRVLGLRDRGRVAESQRADLLLVDGDPFTDISAASRVTQVWKTGVAVSPPG